MKRARWACAAFVTAVAFAWGPVTAEGQQRPDSAIAESARSDSIPRYDLSGITIDVPRPSATAGGASAVEMRLDSITSRPAPTLEDALRGMPLITIRSNSRGEAQPSLRGAEDRQVAVIVDGVPLTLGWDARTDLSAIPLTAARRIRLVRGLSTVLHGPNVLGGAIEIDIARGADRYARPEPLTIQLGADHVGEPSLAVTGGTLADTDRGAWELRAGAGLLEREGAGLPGGIDGALDPRFLTSDGDLRLNSDVRRADGFASARFRHDGGGWFSAAGSGFQAERGVPPEAHVEDPRLWRYPHQNRIIVALSGGTGFHQTRLGMADLEASMGIDVGRTEIEAFSSEAFDDVVETETGDDRTLTFRLTGDAEVTHRTEIRAAATFADVNHDEVIGAGPERSYSQRLWSLGTEVERRFDGLFGTPGLGTTRLTIGLAADGADTPETGGWPTLGRLWDWGARVGVSSLSEGGSVVYHASLSRRTRFPALRELYSGALGRFEPNPDLRAEVLVAGEAGVTVDGATSGLQIVGFHQRLQDGIVRTTIETVGGGRFQRVNQDEVHSTGIEVMAHARFRGTVLSGDLTLQDVTGRDAFGAVTALEYEPTVTGRLGVQAVLPLDVLGSADLAFVGSQLCQNPEAGGLESFDSSPRVDVGLVRSFRFPGAAGLGRMEASLGVSNLGDAAIFDQCGLPQPGRALSLNLRIW